MQVESATDCRGGGKGVADLGCLSVQACHCYHLQQSADAICSDLLSAHIQVSGFIYREHANQGAPSFIQYLLIKLEVLYFWSVYVHIFVCVRTCVCMYK